MDEDHRSPAKVHRQPRRLYSLAEARGVGLRLVNPDAPPRRKKRKPEPSTARPTTLSRDEVEYLLAAYRDLLARWMTHPESPERTAAMKRLSSTLADLEAQRERLSRG